ncbi:hypothetical protein SEA_RAHALELUJAH_79 [Mycobacterium phage Rahalelujah]|nr:hypothetical protein SEA_RAHALELUJAH_79 [Mycobacterium phage Rahalelujah]
MKEIEITVIETVCTVVKAQVADDFDTEDTESLTKVWVEGWYTPPAVSIEVTGRDISAY